VGFEGNTMASDAARHVGQDLLVKADVLAHYLKGLGATDAEFAQQILAEIITRLQTALGAEGKDGRVASPGRSQPKLVASRAIDEIEEFILENLADSPRGLSVQEIVDRLEEAEVEIKRQTLVVRLHRMVQAGKLSSRAHGHYSLSEAEHGRRRSG
jgi:hypothetical protein